VQFKLQAKEDTERGVHAEANAFDSRT